MSLQERVASVPQDGAKAETQKRQKQKAGRWPCRVKHCRGDGETGRARRMRGAD